jgi:heme-degrading monooxygenase HmoA
MIASTPKPPYFAVIFTSIRTDGDNGYSEMAKKMEELAKKQKGFFGMESALDGLGITVSYWKNLESIKNWRNNVKHTVARERGKKEWYKDFKVRIAHVERDYGFPLSKITL